MQVVPSHRARALSDDYEGLTAAEGTKPHTQTVARVMNFLKKLGKEDVEQTKRRGKKLVVVNPEAADRDHDRCDQANKHTPCTECDVLTPNQHEQE